MGNNPPPIGHQSLASYSKFHLLENWRNVGPTGCASDLHSLSFSSTGFDIIGYIEKSEKVFRQVIDVQYNHKD